MTVRSGPCALVAATGRPSVLALLTLLCAETLAAEEVPRPDLVGAEPQVRAKIESSRDAVLARPRDAAAWGQYGMVLHAHRYSASAERAYLAAHALDERNFRWPYYLASLDLGQPEQSVAWYARALDLRPGYAPGHVRLAEALEGLGRLDEAARHFRRAQELDAHEPLAPFGLGRIALALGELEVAIEELERAYALDPGIQSLVATLARARHRNGDGEIAQRLASEARALPRMTHHRDDVRAAVDDLAVDQESYLRRARTYLDVGQLDRAQGEVEALLASHPGSAEAHVMAASIHDRRGEPDAAREEAARALELEPDALEARSLLASSAFKLRRFEQAEQEARRVLAASPDDLHMLLLVGMTAAQRGDAATLIAELDRAFERRMEAPSVRPLLRQLLLDVAVSYAEIGQFDRAAARMAQVLRLDQEIGESEAVIEADRRQLELYRQGRH